MPRQKVWIMEIQDEAAVYCLYLNTRENDAFAFFNCLLSSAFILSRFGHVSIVIVHPGFSILH